MLRRGFSVGAALLLAAFVRAEVAEPAAPPLTVEQIVAGMARRAGEERHRTNDLRHAWRRLTIIEDFDSRGRLEERRSKEHRVVARQGDQESTLVKVNGQAPPERERAREMKREAENRQRYAQRSDRRSERRGNIELDAKMIERFRYQWLSNAVLDGRWMYVLSFAPPTEVSGGKAADRVLGNLGGQIWVDQEVFEVARIQASLLREISIGGFVAQLSDLRFEIERRPLPDGPWVNRKLVSHASGRKLFDRFSGRMEVLQEDFEPLPREAADAE